MRKINKIAIWSGITAAFIASLCCIGPLILITLGLGTASMALSIGAQKPYFLVLGLLLLAISLWLLIKYRQKNICEGCTTKAQKRKRIINTILVAFTIFVILYILLIYVVTPWLAPIVYEIFYKI